MRHIIFGSVAIGVIGSYFDLHYAISGCIAVMWSLLINAIQEAAK